MSEPLCVFCREHPIEDQWRPFCSERCKMLDLARWADGTYRVPAPKEDEADEAVEEDEED